MKKTKLLNVRYLVLITLGSANLFLFQNCSNYSGQVSLSEPKELRANKNLNAIVENSPALIEIGTEIASEPPIEAQVIVQIDPPAVDESAAPEASGTITTVISSSGIESTDQVGTAAAEPHSTDLPSAPAVQPAVGSIEQSSATAPSAEESSEDVAAAESTSNEPSLGAVENPRVDNDRDDDDRDKDHKDSQEVARTETDDHGAQELAQSDTGKDEDSRDQRNELSELPSLSPASSVTSSNVTVMPAAVHGNLCRLFSTAANQVLNIAVVVLGDDSNGKDVTIPNGKVIVISSSSSVLQLNSLAVKGSLIVCGDIKIKKLDFSGNATLIFAQAELASVDGKLTTARLSDSGIQVDVDNQSGSSVKSCSVGEDLKIVSNSTSSSNSHSKKDK